MSERRQRTETRAAAQLAAAVAGATMLAVGGVWLPAPVGAEAVTPAPKTGDQQAASPERMEKDQAVAEKRSAEQDSKSRTEGAQKLNSGPHGALPVAEQLGRIDTLVPPADGGRIPRGVDPVIWKALQPSDNEINPARIALGKKLYFDTRLSKDGTLACATCHDVSRGFTDRRPVSEGIADQLGQRNAPTTMNAFFFQTQFLDGRAPSLEEQAKLPILNPI
jgi:Di-haem cytochrome c peroxidase